jgi:hypothetical protein
MGIKNHKEIRSITEIYKFRWASVVGVPIADVVNTSVLRLRWMASSYVGRLDTTTTSLRSAFRNTNVVQYLGTFTTLPT